MACHSQEGVLDEVDIPSTGQTFNVIGAYIITDVVKLVEWVLPMIMTLMIHFEEDKVLDKVIYLISDILVCMKHLHRVMHVV